MFSKKLEYGYIILKLLKNSSEFNKFSGKYIVEQGNIPTNMGLGILSELSRGGLIKSLKGKNGGFYREPERDITLFELFQVLENQGNNIKYFFNDEFKKDIVYIGAIVMQEMTNIKI